MADGYLTLTEKEKQTLRLLVSGYDAKSMARHLGLSVHTVNERLRDARRKMATSSSREAARQLREAEAPDFLADKQLGAATAIEAAHHRAAKPDTSASRRWVWVIGGIAMLSAIFAVLALSSGSAVTPPAATSVAPATVAISESDPSRAARRWLELGDAARWDEAYAGTAASFRTLNTSARWAEVSNQVRVPLGTLVSRVLIADVEAPTPPAGARIIKFRTSFASKADATETVSLVREGDGWKVSGIYLD